MFIPFIPMTKQVSYIKWVDVQKVAPKLFLTNLPPQCPHLSCLNTTHWKGEVLCQQLFQMILLEQSKQNNRALT